MAQAVPLRLGDSVLFKQYGTQSFIVRSTGTQGFGAAFVDLKTNHTHTEGIASSSVHYPPDLSDAVFTVLPPAKYANASKLAKMQAAQDDGEDDKRGLQLYTYLKDAAESERTINLIEAKRDLGNPLCFGDEVQLRHFSSGQYLSGAVYEGFDEGQPMMLAEPDPSVIFQIEPGYKADRIGDTVYIGQLFTLRSAESRLMLGKNPEQSRPNPVEHVHVTRHSRAAMSDPPVQVAVLLYCPLPESVAEANNPVGGVNLLGGAVVQLRHCEMASHLAFFDDEVQMQLDKLQLNQSAKMDFDINGIWRVELLSDGAMGGDNVVSGSTVSLRHFMSGKYLSEDESGALVLTSDWMRKGAQFQFTLHTGGNP